MKWVSVKENPTAPILERLEPRTLLSAAWDVVLIDAQLPQSLELVYAASGAEQVVVYDSQQESATDVLARAAELVLSAGRRMASLSILSHGAPGGFALGSDWISAGNIEATASAWADLGKSMADGADLYLYACSVAAPTGSGRELLDRLADLTGADIAASVDDTGSAQRGGDWELEYRIGDVEAPIAFTMQVQQNWSGLLVTPVITARETVDNDANGQIDAVRITTDQALDDDFSGLTMTVAGYSVTGYSSDIANDTIFYVNLTESGGPDTDATPSVTVTANTTLSEDGGSNNIATDPAGWWDSDWRNRTKITFTGNNPAGTENLDDFPVLVSLTAADVDYSKTEDLGADIRFVDDDGTTPLKYEIEKWDELGTSTVWVKVPQVDTASNTDFIWIYYNNSGASDGQDANAVWDANYQGVWHMDESTTGSTDIGGGETGTPSNNPSSTPTWAYFDENNVVNADGQITEVKINVDTVGNGDLRIMTASRSGNTFTVRDFQNLTVIGAGVQTFSVDLDVAAGDYLGFWSDSVSVERETTGSSQYLFVDTGTTPTVGGQYAATQGTNSLRLMISGTGDAISIVESTSNPNDGGVAGSTDITGQIGDGQDFDGTNDYIQADLPSFMTNIGANDFTIEFMFNADDVTSDTTWIRLMDIRDDNDEFMQFVFDDAAAGKLTFAVEDYGIQRSIAVDTNLVAGTWYHAVGVWDASANDVDLYLNGIEQTTAGATDAGEGAVQAVTLGRRSDGNASTYYEGLMDEVRISDSTRSADWIEASYLSQNGIFAFNTFASEETQPVATTDTAAPVVSSVIMSDSALKVGETSTLTITFSEAVNNFDNTDITLANGTLTPVSSGDGGVTWTGTFTPTNDIEDATNVISVGTTLTDLAGNAPLAGNSTSNYSIDTKEPTVAITRDDANPTNANSVVFSVDFSEDVTNVDAADFILALSGVTANAMVTVGNAGDSDASTYTVTVETIAGDGTLGLDVAGGNNITDLATNAVNTTPTTDEVYTIDNIPPVITAAQSFNVPEDAADTTSVGTVAATDAGTLQAWTITAGNGDGIFAINAGTGEITIADNTNLDRETTDTYVLTLTVGDGANTSDTETVTINVTDVNDTAPVITAAQSFNVSEGAADTTSVGTVAATDADTTGSLQSWTITAGNGDLIFAINAGTGEITVADNTNLNREMTDTYVLTLTVGDGVNTSATETVTINVTDVNDTAPVITASQSFDVEEDEVDTTSVGTVLATDADTTGSLQSWTITLGNDDGVFGINGLTGEITVVDNTNLDFETTESYVLSLTVGDGVNTSNVETVTINVLNTNEDGVGPISDNNASADAVAEDAATGTGAGITAFADDPDGGDAVTYSLDDDAGGLFEIDENTGVVTLNGALDRETASSHTITVRATSIDTSSRTKDFTISVTDVNDNAPVITAAQSFNVAEDAADTTSVGTVVATDADTTGSLQSWTITAGNGDGIFGINAGTGEITVADNTNLDHETTDTYVLTLTVGDGVNTSGAETVTLNVTNVNEAPVINNQSLGPINENLANSTVVGTPAASDVDDGDSLTWSITAGNTANAFAINSSNGQITVNNQAALDFETNPTFSLTVQVEDTGALTDDATVTINLNDLNEAPVINNQSLGPINENLANSSVVGTPVTSDVDASDSLTWTITAGNTGNAFAIDPNTGEITVNNSSALDYDATPNFNLTVQIEDTGALIDTATVTINLNDLNDEPPVIRPNASLDLPYLPDMNAPFESPDSMGPSAPPFNMPEEHKPDPRPETGRVNPLLMLFELDPGVPDVPADGTGENADAADLPAPEPQQDAPADPGDTPKTTGDDQHDASEDTASPVSQGRGNGTQTVQPTKEDEGEPREPNVQKRQTDRQTGSHKGREKLTVSVVTGMAMAALAAHFICFSTDPISLIQDRRGYSSLNGPHIR